MMKKIYVVFGLLVMASGVFAQTFSLGGHLVTNFENVLPTFEMELNFSKVDVLAGVSFWRYQNDTSYDNYQTNNVENKLDERRFKIFAGFAPKVTATEGALL
jgi:hypothetical protein